MPCCCLGTKTQNTFRYVDTKGKKQGRKLRLAGWFLLMQWNVTKVQVCIHTTSAHEHVTKIHQSLTKQTNSQAYLNLFHLSFSALVKRAIHDYENTVSVCIQKKEIVGCNCLKLWFLMHKPLCIDNLIQGSAGTDFPVKMHAVWSLFHKTDKMNIIVCTHCVPPFNTETGWLFALFMLHNSNLPP